ncbi:hypothetical protein Tco_1420281, partial [Tanacetum coccineum]
KRLSSLGTQLKQQQDNVINKYNTLWKVISEKSDNALAHDNAGDSMARVNAVSINHPESDAPLRKGIKSPSKLLSLKYQSQSSLGDQNRSSSSPKRVYFVNTFTVIRNDDKSREAGTIKSNAAEDNGRDTIVEGEKETEEGLDSSDPVIKEDESQDIKWNDLNDKTCGETKEEEEVEEETEESEEETKEEEEDDPKYFNTFLTIDELSYHEWLLKNPRPPWVSAKVIFDEKKLRSS